MSDSLEATPLAGTEAILARRYSGALYALAEKENAVDAVAGDMRGLCRLWAESPEWRSIARDPRASSKQTKAAIGQICKISGFNGLTAHFLDVVADNRRLRLIAAIAEAFLDAVATGRGEYRADVRVAAPMTDAQRESLSASLRDVAGGKVNITVIEDSSILGGLTVKLGSRFIDASVKTRLDKLERTLKAVG